jgi:predicted N-acetyltransferase YhbS
VPLFQPYRPELSPHERPPRALDLVIRAAEPADVPALAAIEAAREGGERGVHAEKLEKLIEASTSAQALLPMAQHEGRTVGLAKITRFTRPPTATPNVAPAGWYWSGVIVAQDHRRRGIGLRLTEARLHWIAARASEAYYFAHARNLTSVDLHRPLGFVEITRDFTLPGATFEGGVGVLFKAELVPARNEGI